jgi:serine protease
MAVAVVCSSPVAWAGGADADSLAATAQAVAASLSQPLTDQMIIKYRKGTAGAGRADIATLSQVHAAFNRDGIQLRHLRRHGVDAHVMKLDRHVDVDHLQRLAKVIAALDPDIDYAEADRRMFAMLTPNDARYGEQWHYFEATGGLNAPTAWDSTTGGGVVVAVLDTGYRPHADLNANIVAGYDMIIDTAVSNDGNGRDNSALDPGDWTVAGECGANSAATNSTWHGTHVAGTIAAVTNNASGVAGVAFGAKVQPVRVLGKCGGYTSDIADGITWASGGTVNGLPANATPAHVINLSLGGGGSCSTTTQAAINGARGRGTVVVVAAGNSNANAANFTPASCSGVITVAAVNRDGGRAYYSNFGANVDVAAPGGDVRTAATNGVLSTLNSGTTTPGADNYAWYQGTSMATPHVAALAALMKARNAALTPDQIENLLKSSARSFPATCTQCGSGIVNAAAAVAAAVSGGASTTVVAESTAANNTIATAQPITPNPAQVNGSISSASDTDYYAVSLAAGATLTATLTPPTSADFDLYFYDSAGATLASSTLGTGAVDTASYRHTGTAALTVYVRSARFRGTGSYTLLLSQ